jgi:hypothetical protein
MVSDVEAFGSHATRARCGERSVCIRLEQRSLDSGCPPRTDQVCLWESVRQGDAIALKRELECGLPAALIKNIDR